MIESGAPLSGVTRIIFLVYFITHIPITLLVDGQAALTSSLYPDILKELQTFYINDFKDPLMAKLPIWFQIAVWIEVLIQLPYFFFAVKWILEGSKQFRIPTLIYSSHVSTVVAIILGCFALDETINLNQKATLIAIYSPYLLIPLWLLFICAAYENPFLNQPPKKTLVAKVL